MRAITLHQPWASLIALGIKSVETRSWVTGYRGQLAIHAAKRPIKQSELDAIAYAYKCQLAICAANRPIERCKIKMISQLSSTWLDEIAYPLGCVVAVCDVADCIGITPQLISQQLPAELVVGNWESGRYAWLLSNVQPIRAVPASGKQGFWDWTPPSNLL